MKIRLGIGVENIHPFDAFDSSYQSLLDRATALGYTLPSAPQQVLQNQLILDLKSSGAWDKMDVFYMFANNGSSGFGRLNWKSPSNNEATIVGANLTWNASGFVGGASSYLNTNFNPTTGTPNIQRDNACIGVWKRTHNTTTGRFLWGNSGASSYAPSINASDVRLHNNGGLNNTFGLSSTGLLMLNRTGSTAITHSVNGTNTNATTSASVVPVSANYSVFTYGTVTASVYLGQLSCWFIGASLVSETSALYTALNTYIATT
jgi:hypothetical protein